MKMMVDTGKAANNVQFILITPQDMGVSLGLDSNARRSESDLSDNAVALWTRGPCQQARRSREECVVSSPDLSRTDDLDLCRPRSPRCWTLSAHRFASFSLLLYTCTEVVKDVHAIADLCFIAEIDPAPRRELVRALNAWICYRKLSHRL